MQIQINTDDHISGEEALLERMRGTIGSALAHFGDQISRVEGHLSDENAGKSGPADKRCLLEARPLNQPPLAVSHNAATLDEACNGAAKKLRHALETRFGKQQSHKGAPSIRDNDNS